MASRDSLIRKKVHSRHVFIVNTSKPLPHQLITFRAKDGVSYPYDDAMVIIVNIVGLTVKRILVDSEALIVS